MPKTKKRQALEVGQRIWIESYGAFYRDTRTITEYEVVKTNKSSAYAIRVEDLGKENPNQKRIEQRTGKVNEPYNLGEVYRLWDSKEAFEKNVKMLKEKAEMKEEALRKVASMSYQELKDFLDKN